MLLSQLSLPAECGGAGATLGRSLLKVGRLGGVVGRGALGRGTWS